MQFLSQYLNTHQKRQIIAHSLEDALGIVAFAGLLSLVVHLLIATA
jgi:hypothetical protein